MPPAPEPEPELDPVKAALRETGRDFFDAPPAQSATAAL